MAIRDYRRGMKVLQWNPYTNIANLTLPFRYIKTPPVMINELKSKKE